MDGGEGGIVCVDPAVMAEEGRVQSVALWLTCNMDSIYFEVSPVKKTQLAVKGDVFSYLPFALKSGITEICFTQTADVLKESWDMKFRTPKKSCSHFLLMFLEGFSFVVAVAVLRPSGSAILVPFLVIVLRCSSHYQVHMLVI